MDQMWTRLFQKINELILQDHPEFPAWVIMVPAQFILFTMHLAKGWNYLGKKLINFIWICIHCSKYSAARWEDFKEIKIEMDLEVHNFQQHTEVHWLSIGPSLKRILEQWQPICCFVAELAKNPKKVPKSVNYDRVYMLLGTKEKAVTKVALECFNNLIPLYEQFVLLFQKSSLMVDMVYDCNVWHSG